ncbi:putative regulatory protein, FmdB family [Variovorax sp. SRS16]|uniref:FmdB family zinc ribbon protein n=1 Tax=Variovorax sp. SRS16 TaxID=282217 RepID=UPI001317C37D|nr:FmdB family zinc ribbon protein [Variovorax sp. SRS16]VTU14703.1 putative regulatory protein, FmdB family [Variovorax sp. SRS16]
MPIYAYKCGACGFAKDALQKLSDAPLTECPSCGASAFSKQLTAAGFQLKGSGWYVTDFRDGGGKKGGEKNGGEKNGDKGAEPAAAPAAPADGTAAKPAETAAKSPAPAPAPAPAAAPAAKSD